MKYERIIRAISEMPWAILPSKLDEILAFIEFKAEGGQVAVKDIEALKAAAPAPVRAGGSVQVLNLYGVMSQRMDMMSEMSGGTSTERLGRQINQAVQDPAVSAIVLNIDSPGGSAFGVGELADQIRVARAKKPIVAIANSMAASGAYWTASAASEVVVTPGGLVGSVGVYSVHQDLSALEAAMGVKTTYISAGEYKTEGNSSQPLSEEALAYMQSMVDKYYSMFVSAVAKGRGVSVEKVRSDFGQGRVVLAQDALAAGMVDSIETLDQVVTRLARGKTLKSGMSAASQLERFRLATA